VEQLGPETRGEAELRADAKRFRVVAIVAGIVCAPFALVHATFFLTVGVMDRLFEDMGGQVPAVTQLLTGLGRTGMLSVLLLLVDIAIFVIFYRLAKRYWIGLLFVPALAYIMISSVLALLLYLPMYQVIELVK
jgi:hypothetical protein